jgi:SAM-dependent methyltransferase
MPEDAERRWVGSMPEAYERWLGPSVFRPFAVDLARRAAAHDPGRVLELAAGTGLVTRELLAALPSAQVTATDLNQSMVDFGARQAPGARWRQADALHLPFVEERFDLVACQFGVMFFPDKPAAFAQARRVLAPGGRFLASVWGTVAEHGFAAALGAGLERAFPHDPLTFIAAIPHGYHDLDRFADDLAAGGLRCTGTETITLQGRAESAADIARGFCTGTPVRAEIEARGDLDETVAIVAREIEARLGSGPVTASMRAHVVEAVPAPAP